LTNPKSIQAEQEAIRKLIQDMERMRDALVSLSLLASDLVFEVSQFDDARTSMNVKGVIEKMKA